MSGPDTDGTPTAGEKTSRRVPRCDSCGITLDVATEIRPHRVHEFCAPCRLEFERTDAFEDELARLIRPWVEACRVRGVREREIDDLIRHVYERHWAPRDGVEA